MRTMALDLRKVELGGGMVLITSFDADGQETDQVAATLDEVESWDPKVQPLPTAAGDPDSLPPDGFDDIERCTIVGCGKALSQAIASDTLTQEQVRAIMNIIHDAFSGLGPAGLPEVEPRD